MARSYDDLVTEAHRRMEAQAEIGERAANLLRAHAALNDLATERHHASRSKKRSLTNDERTLIEAALLHIQQHREEDGDLPVDVEAYCDLFMSPGAPRDFSKLIKALQKQSNANTQTRRG